MADDEQADKQTDEPRPDANLHPEPAAPRRETAPGATEIPNPTGPGLADPEFPAQPPASERPAADRDRGEVPPGN